MASGFGLQAEVAKTQARLACVCLAQLYNDKVDYFGKLYLSLGLTVLALQYMLTLPKYRWVRYLLCDCPFL